MKYDFAVEKQFEKFVKNTTCGAVLTDARLQIIKKYFQYCYEAGHAQGYADRIYDEQSNENELNNPDNMGPDVKFIDDICEALNS